MNLNGTSQGLSFSTGYVKWPDLDSLSSLLISNKWHYIYTSIIHYDGDTVDQLVKIDSTSVLQNFSPTSDYTYRDKSYTKYIGCQYDWCKQGKTGFSGFMYYFHVYNDGSNNIYESEFHESGCSSGCSACPTTSMCLPSDCLITQYYNSTDSICYLCLATCTHGCYNPNDCNLCSIPGCLTCTGSNVCGKCSGDYKFIGSTCRCSYSYSVLNATESTCGCSSQTISYQSLCISSCPTGSSYDATSETCVLDANAGLIFSLTLNQIKGIVIDKVYSFQVLAGTSTDFYPTYGSYDPIPSYRRGYYFNGGSLMQLPPNSVMNTNSLYFSSHVTVSVWMWPRANNGVILAKQASASPFTVYLSFELIALKLFVNVYSSETSTSQQFYSQNSLTTTNWHHVGFSLSYSFPYNQVTFYENFLTNLAIPAKGPLLDIESSYTILIGAKYSSQQTLLAMLTGFIYSIKIWNIIINLSPEVSSTCSECNFCPSSYTPNCLQPFQINMYYDTTQQLWSACSSSCDNLGCVRYDTACNLCDNQLCALCDDWTGCISCMNNCQTGTFLVTTPCSCVPCISNCVTCTAQTFAGCSKCASGYYLDGLNNACSACALGCDTCSGQHNGDCLTCKSGYYLNPGGLCLPSCPLGYSGNPCSGASALAIHYIFNKETNTVSDLVGGYKAYMGSSDQYMGNFDVNDPYPIYQSGLYFNGQAYMKLPPNSADQQEAVLGNAHSLLIWFRPLSTSNLQYLISKELSSDSFYISINDSLLFEVTYYVYDDITASYKGYIYSEASSQLSWNYWQNIIVIFQRTSYAPGFSFYINQVQATNINSITNSMFIDFSRSNFIVGYSFQHSLYFKGFIYEISIYNYAITYQAPSNNCGCSDCANSGNDCLRPCAFNEFYDGSCKGCDGGCATGCMRNGNCYMNLDPLCVSATGFAISECTSCITNASGAGTQCNCISHMHYDLQTLACVCDSTWPYCISCDSYCSQCTGNYYYLCDLCIAGKVLVDGVCLDSCPYGFSSPCISPTSSVIDQLFNGNFQGLYGIFQTATSSSSYQPFISPEAQDPYPVKNRGLYFYQGSYLVTTQSITLNSWFSIGFWIYVIFHGTFAWTTDSLSINSDMGITLLGESISFPADYYGWYYLSFSVSYSQDTVPVSIYKNGSKQNTATLTQNKIFRVSSSLINVGARLPGSFVGFIYSFALWNEVTSDFSSQLSQPCGSSVGDVSCLWSCDVNQYKDLQGYKYCHDCYNGCTTKNSCNICDDPLCAVCTGFGSEMCTTCVDNASGTPCACNANYISPDGFSCTLKCFTGCSSCLSTSYTSCTSCAQNYFLYQMICYTTCPQGTISNSVTKTCDKDFPMSISLDFYALASLPSSYSSASGKTPYFISDRGWRFFPQSYISTSVQLSSYITISMWICFTAYTSIDTIFYMSRDWGISYNGSNKQLVFNTGPIVWSQAQSLSTLDINTWHFLFISTIHNSDGTIKQLIQLDSTSLTQDSLTPASDFIFQDKGGSKYIGSQFDWNNRGYTSFTGYMYWLHVYNDGLYYTPNYEPASSNCPSCSSLCLLSLYCLPGICPYSQYYYNSGCLSCNGCSNGCSNSNDCILCTITSCATCTGTSTCGSCIGNYVFLDGECQCPYTWVSNTASSTCICSSSLKFNDVCVSSCPTGTSDNLSGVCTLQASQGLVLSLAFNQIKGTVVDSSDSNIKVLAGISSDYYPNYDPYDPIPAYKRGYYFNGHSLMQLPPHSYDNTYSLNFATDFSYSAWIWPQGGDGVIFTKQSDGYPYSIYLSIEISSLQAFFSFHDPILNSLYSYSSSAPINTSGWYYIGFSLRYKFPYNQLTWYVNSNFDTPFVLKHPFVDLISDYTILIGATHKNSDEWMNFYTGFIYSMKIWNTVVNPTLYDLSYTCDSGCSFCPLASSSCLPNQPISSYYDLSSSSWKACSDSCKSTGCVRSDGFCNLCDDNLCDICEDWTGCKTCKANTKPSQFPCQCASGFYYDSSANQCTACFSFCSVCTSSHNGDCSGCNSNYYLTPENLCLSTCPLGYTQVSGSPCTAVSPNSIVLHYVFTKLTNTIADKVSGFLAYMGSTDTYLGPNDPWPIYQSGLYFSGSSYVSLPPNSVDSKEVVLGNNHSLLFWIRPTSSSTSGIIYSKENASQIHSYFMIDSNSNPYVNYAVYDDTTMASNNIHLKASSITNNGWYNIVILLSWTPHCNQISIYVNGVLDTYESFAQVQNSYFMDISGDNFLLGASKAEGIFYTGFIFEMALYNYVISIQSITSGCMCSACADSGNECLRSCSYLQYYNSATSSCADCDSSCQFGCVRNGDCIMSLDPLCAAETGFQISECTSCVTGAIGAGTTCACLQNYVYDSSSRTCTCDPNLYPCGRCDSLCTSCLNYNYFTCSSCTGSGVYLDQVCLNECPYGLFSNSVCASNASPVIDQLFNGDFLGSYGIFKTAQSDTNYYFFNNPENFDPIPAYQRGLYFSNGKYLCSATPIYLNAWLTIGLWTYTIFNGIIVSKGSVFTLSSSLVASVSLTTFKGNSSISTTPIPYTGWTYIAISMAYTSDSVVMKFYLGSTLSTTLTTQYALFRDANSESLFLGSQTSSFVGFIYSFTLWNQLATDFSAQLSKPCSAVLDTSCLWECDIFMYNEGGNYVTCNNCYNGCVRGKSCNICKDPLCKFCTGFGDQCSECVENASGTPCACLAGFSSPDGFSCTSGCARGCAGCLSTSYSDCTSCQPGYFLYQMICYKSCPAGTLSNSVTNSCDQDSVFSISLDFYSLATLPSAYTAVGADYINNRGWYFEPTDYVSTENKLSYFFGVSLWIFFTGYINEDTIFYIGRDSGFSIKGSSQTLTLKTPYSPFIDNQVTLSYNSWHYIYFSVFREDAGKLTETLVIDSNSVSQTISFANTYIDPDTNYVKYIGSCPEWAARGIAGFSGFIYFFHVFRDAQNPFPSSEYITSGCPPSLVCPSRNCNYNEYLDSYCFSCLASCTHGCANGNDCNLCSLAGCDACTGASTCGLCNGDLFFIDGECKCRYTFSALDTSTCYCPSGLQFKSACVNFCPTGTLNYGEGMSCDLDSHQGWVFSLLLDKIEGIVTDSINSISVLAGNSDIFYPTYDSNDPIPAYKRGYYFNGNSLMQLPPHVKSSSSSLNFGTDATFSVWIQPNSPTSGTKQIIFSKQSSPTAALIELSIKSSNLYVRTQSLLGQQMYVSYHALSSQGWNYVGFSLSYSFPYTQVTFYINSQFDMAAPAKSPLLDSNTAYTILIGAQYASSSTFSDFFTGFIYSMNIWIVPTNPTLNDVSYNCNSGCTICPVGYAPNCLVTEPISNYYDSSTSSWLQCLSSCTLKGCVRYDDVCNLCDDPLCASCNDWTGCLACIDNCDPVQPPCTCKSGYWLSNGICTNCLDGAVLQGNICICSDLNASYDYSLRKCVCNSGYRLYNDLCTNCPINAIPQRSTCVCSIDNASYDSALNQCICNSYYYMDQGVCIACVNYLDSTNIAASFINSYSGIQFDFNIPADLSPGSCSSSFDSATLSKFGSGYSCSFASDFNSITVLLGKNYTFSRENAIFVPGALISSSPLCGKNKLQVSVPVALQGDLPTPKFTYTAPATLELSCQDLLLSAIIIKGLPYETYKWTISSNPYDSVISSYSTQYSSSYADINISKDNLIEAIIYVSFSMKNNFGSILTISKQINATSSPILTINIDTSLTSIFDRLKSYAISIGSITSCQVSDNLSIAWSISKIINNASSIDESTLWSAQNSQYLLIIPPKTLPASSTITFNVFAKDLTYSSSGEASFNVETASSDPIIVFSRPDGDSGVSQELEVDSSNSYDPDYNSNFLFQWSCRIYNSAIDYSSLIQDRASSVLKVPANTLTLGTVYSFTLNFTKITTNPLSTIKSSQKSIIITVVNKSVPPVNIVEVSNSNPSIANSDATYRISIEGSLSSIDWSLKSSSDIAYSTPLDSNYLVISQNSLTPGASYTLLAYVNDNFKFTWTFYVNQPPTNGNILVVPDAGLEMSTIFTISALEWEDPESNLPLEYSFGYYISDTYQVLSAKNLSSLIFATFPFSPASIKVSVDIYDSLSSKTNKFSYVTINENPNINQYIDYHMNLPTLNPQAIPEFVAELSSLILNRDDIINNEYSEIDTQMQSSYDIAIDKINFYIGTMDKYSEDSYTTIFYMLYIITLNPYINTYDNIEKISIVSDYMIENNKDFTIEDSQMQIFTGICNNNFKLSDYEAINHTATVNLIDENVRKISAVLLEGMVPGESHTFIDDDVSVEVSKAKTSDLSNHKFTLNQASFTLGSNISDYFKDIEDVGIILAVYNPTHNSTDAPWFSLVSFRLINLKTYKEFYLNDTSYNTINIPVQNYQESKKDNPIYCTFLDHNGTRWQSTGCFLDSFNETDVVCKCNHLSIFSAFYEDAWSTASGSNIGETINVNAFSDFDWSTNAIGLYFCLAVLFIYAVLSVFACKMDWAEKKSKEKSLAFDQGKPDDFVMKNDMMMQAKRRDRSTIIKFDADDQENSPGLKDDKIETARSEESAIYNTEMVVVSVGSAEKTKDSSDMSIVRLDSTEIINVEDFKNQVKEEQPIRKIFRVLIFVAKNHDLITIFVSEEKQTHFSRLTAYMINILGNMYFIGLFYQSEPSDSESGYSIDSFQKVVNSYSFQDFWIMVYSSGIMLVIGILMSYASIITPVPPFDDTLYQRIKKKNCIKLCAFYFLSFGVLFYFCWSIILFSIQFELSVTYLWICNTSVSYGSNLFVISFIKIAFKGFVIWLLPIIVMSIGISNRKVEKKDKQ
ncbi:unnamed protein product [Blepharisma stoltei]|uniref:EGF-like domain-containing protein n=1 Tax=Blepharisma stoltei TaxID=1481888 RepID=A0AAU9J442_9CILI|nr:unnamed protein product [Blepharisma stoltei]